jgi:hypothetical protein
MIIISIVLALAGGTAGLFLGRFIWKTSGYVKILVSRENILLAACIAAGLVVLPLLFILITALPYSQ